MPPSFSRRIGIFSQSEGLWWRRGFDRHHLGRKAIAISGHRLNAAALRSVRIEDVTQLGDLDIHIGFLDYLPRPDDRHDLVFRDKVPFPPEQQSEQVERAATESGRRYDPGLIQP